MKILPFKSTQRIIIDPGEYYVSRNREVISTLLGSCVAACLYDPVNGVIGMNHFLLAYRRQGANSEGETFDEGRYGDHAMELLIREMIKQGADRFNLQAKCFGGGNVVSYADKQKQRQTVGDDNVLFIKKFLQNKNIPLVSAALGGNAGRNIHFVGSDYSVFVDEIDSSVQQLLDNDLRRYWQTGAAD